MLPPVPSRRSRAPHPQGKHCLVLPLRFGSNKKWKAVGAGRERGSRSPALGTSWLKPLRGGMKFSPSTSLLHTATFQKLNVNMQRFVRWGDWRGKEKKIKGGRGGRVIKTWSNLCILSAFSSWHGGVVLHVYYNLPNNTADNYYNLYF